MTNSTLIPLKIWKIIDKSGIAKLLRPLGLWLRDNGIAKQVHFEWDMREDKGEFWELEGWRVGPVAIPFSEPRRNRLMEMTTTQVLVMWKRLGSRRRWV